MDKLDLRADLENRIYQSQKKSHASKWIIFGATAIVTVGLLLYLNKDISPIEFNEQEKKAVFLPKPTKNPFDTSKKAPNPELAQSTRSHINNNEDIVIRPGARKELLHENKIITSEESSSIKPIKKQTVFNDSNYQPSGSVNSIAPPPNRYYDSGQARTNAQVQEINRSFSGVTTKRTVPWQWKSQKSHRSGKFTYSQTDRGIDTNGVCSNYKHGSFEYRDCRKAAKRYFQNACSNEFRAACNAGEMIP